MIGFSPDEIDRMSLWQLRAVTVGWALAHGAEVEVPFGADAFDAAAAALDAAPDTTT